MLGEKWKIGQKDKDNGNVSGITSVFRGGHEQQGGFWDERGQCRKMQGTVAVIERMMGRGGGCRAAGPEQLATTAATRAQRAAAGFT